MIDAAAFQMLLLTVTSWLDRRECAVLAYLIEENRVLRRQVGGRRLRLTDDDRRQLAARAYRLGRQGAARGRDDRHAGHVAPLAPATHRPQMDLCQAGNDASRTARGTPPIDPADGGGESWVGLHAHPRCPQEPRAPRRPVNDCTDPASSRDSARARPTSWQTFLRAHWGEIAAADFFTTEVWTWHGLVTFYTVFVIELASRRVQILGSTPHPDETFMGQIVRNLSLGDAEGCGVPICDRDAKWSRAVRARLQDAGIRVVQTPYRAPNANAYAERFVRSIKEECLNRVIQFGERHHRRAVAEFVVHYRERNHQGLDNELIDGDRAKAASRSSASAPTSRWVAQLLRRAA